MDMTLYCEFELFNNPAIDLRLFDILVSVKAEIRDILADLDEELEKDKASITIHLKPGHCGITTNILNENLFKKVSTLLGDYNFEGVVRRLSGIELN